MESFEDSSELAKEHHSNLGAIQTSSVPLFPTFTPEKAHKQDQKSLQVFSINSNEGSKSRTEMAVSGHLSKMAEVSPFKSISVMKALQNEVVLGESDDWIDLGSTAAEDGLIDKMSSLRVAERAGRFKFPPSQSMDEIDTYFDAETTLPSPLTPSFAALPSTSSSNAVLSSHDYFTSRSNKPSQRNSPLPTIPSSPLPFPSPPPMSSLLLPPSTPSPNPSSYSSTFESPFFTESPLESPSSSSLTTPDADSNLATKRYYALVELVDTETGYLESLRILVTVRSYSFLSLTFIEEIQVY